MKVSIFVFSLVLLGLFATTDLVSQPKQAKLVIFTVCPEYGSLKILVDGQYKGTLDKYVTTTKKSLGYGDRGTISIMVDVGSHTIQAYDLDGEMHWDATVYVRENGSCEKLTCNDNDHVKKR